ncbi:DUF6680 family protein [Roseateles sp.]|uniref:DUF6680 family protein n=1 Tax=Roseateles sp. TaxID=1971397 RepID=UPI003D13E267
MDTKDWIVVVATLLGPILAVQAQKWIEGIREQKDRKTRVFTQLMATRAARLTPDHVQALNMIDLVFYGGFVFGIHHRTRKEQAILDAWKEYHDNLGEGADLAEAQQQAHYAKREELFLNLLYAMAQDVGFTFDRVQLKRGAYTPVAHEEIEADQRILRKALIQTMSGDSPLSMRVLQMPANPELAEEYRRNIERIAIALEAKAHEPVQVERVPVA